MKPYPSGADIRGVVLKRAREYRELTGISMSALGAIIKNDKRLFMDIDKGRNITVDLYDFIMIWFDGHWPAEDKTTVKAGGVLAQS